MVLAERAHRTPQPSTPQVYHDHQLVQLVTKHSFEEVVYRTWHDDLPDASQLRTHLERERALRPLDRRLQHLLQALPTTIRPVDVLRVAVGSLLPDWAGGGGLGGADRVAALALLARIPTVVALDHRRRRGLEPISPRSDLGYVENLLHMCFGVVPEAGLVRALEVVLVIQGWSELDARSAVPTHANFRDVVLNGLDGLEESRPLGIEAATRMFEQVGDADDAERWLARELAAERTISGFGAGPGWRDDPLVEILRVELERLTALRGTIEPLATYHVLASAMLRETGLRPGSDYPSGLLLRLIGFDHRTAVAILVVARIAGWLMPIMSRPGVEPAV